MVQILIRNLDETTLERLKLRATQGGRSLQAEVKMIRDQAAHVDLQTARLTAARIREKLKGRPASDSVGLPREERYVRMSTYVVDASVAAKWFFDEPLSDEATRLLDASHALHVPDSFVLEIDNVLCRKMRRGEISEGEAQEIRSAIDILPLQKHPFQLLMAPAFELAVQPKAALMIARI